MLSGIPQRGMFIFAIVAASSSPEKKDDRFINYSPSSKPDHELLYMQINQVLKVYPITMHVQCMFPIVIQQQINSMAGYTYCQRP